MSKDTGELLGILQQGQEVIKEHLPGLLEGFQGLSQSILKEKQLTPKFKELIAVAVAVGIHCQP